MEVTAGQESQWPSSFAEAVRRVPQMESVNAFTSRGSRENGASFEFVI